MCSKKVRDFDIIVCKNIKSMRKMIGMTQQMLAKELDITPQQLHKYENGMDRVSTNTLSKMCEIFGCDIADLLPKKEERANLSGLKVAERGKGFTIANQNVNTDMLEIMNAFFNLPKKQQLTAKKTFIDICANLKLDKAN